ncbi:GNAT family N-acetyltransferase [Hymenobacter sp. B81]|uniref:GNAT family N-acetyltransferase n=1 Tax=Hymenobacter sp. B81 TaxID=3344878 RepID=UPI0037DD191D
MLTIRRVIHPEPALLPGLSQLLLDTVLGGASVGFLDTLTVAEATAYWQGIFAGLGPELALWVAEDDGAVLGTGQLALCAKPNGRHRAEVQKLQVLSQARGRGLASRLLAAIEAFARQQQRSLLVLDTAAGSPAEAIYRHLGWQKAGEIPHYATSPDGVLLATAYYYKLL